MVNLWEYESCKMGGVVDESWGKTIVGCWWSGGEDC